MLAVELELSRQTVAEFIPKVLYLASKILVLELHALGCGFHTFYWLGRWFGLLYSSSQAHSEVRCADALARIWSATYCPVLSYQQPWGVHTVTIRHPRGNLRALSCANAQWSLRFFALWLLKLKFGQNVHLPGRWIFLASSFLFLLASQPIFHRLLRCFEALNTSLMNVCHLRFVLTGSVLRLV